MNYQKLMASVLSIFVLSLIIVPSASADTIITDDGTAYIEPNGFEVIKTFHTANPTTGDPSYLTCILTKLQNSTVDDYRVLILDEANYDNFVVSSAYSSYYLENSSGGSIFITDLSFDTEDTYYLIVDNQGNSGELAVNYAISLGNAEIVKQIIEMVWLMILGIIVALVVIILVIVLLVRKKRTAPPPMAPPMGPQPVGTKFCTSCGKSMPGDARHCPYCGKQQ